MAKSLEEAAAVAQVNAAPDEAPVAKEEVSTKTQLSEKEESDLEVVTAMARNLLVKGGGIETMQKALKSSRDPGQVVGQFMAQMILQMQQNMPKDLDISPKVYLAEGGMLEQTLDLIEDYLDLPKEFSDQVYGECVETIKGAAQGASKAPSGGLEAGGAPAPAAGPAMPPSAPQGGGGLQGGGY